MDNPLDKLRNLPSVNELLEAPQLKSLIDKVSHNAVVSSARGVLDDLRSKIKEANVTDIPSPSEIVETVADWVSSDEKPRLRRVINATGVMLHTGLGRAPLSQETLKAINEMGGGYASVEVDIESGKRTKRRLIVESLLKELTGCEAALVVNNNAAATMLTLTALGHSKEIIVSRGELIEIGGSYRLPDVMTSAGAILREVGTTNKTRISDYKNAINEETAAIMKVHTSNFKVCGFTEETPLKEMVALGKETGVPVIDDVGSGALVDFAKYGLQDEPNIVDSVKAGADVVLFSGDKLLGGPQCGIIVGKKKFIEKFANHPMTRALRVDKITFAALYETLLAYRDLGQAEDKIPLLRMLAASGSNLKQRAERLAVQLNTFPVFESAEIVEDSSMLGGGSIPTQTLPTWCVALKPTKGSLDLLSQRLRTGNPSIWGRVQNECLMLDLRTILPGEEIEIVEVCEKLDADR